MASTVPRVTGVDDAVVPQPPRGELRRRLLLDLVLRRLAQLLVGGLVEGAARRGGRVAAHDGQHAGQLLGPHDGDAVIGPGEDEARVIRTASHGVVARPVAGAHHEREVGHGRVRHGVDQLGPVLDDAALLVARPHHEARDVLHEQDRSIATVAERNELRSLLRLGREQDAVVGDHADRVAADRRPPAHQLGAVQSLELLEAGAVHYPGDDLAHVEGHAHVHRGDPEQLLGRVERLVSRFDGPGAEAGPVQVGDDAPRHADRLGLVTGQVVTEARDLGVHARTPQILLIGLLSDGHLDERRPAEEDARPVLDHDGVIAHAGEVGPTGGGGAEHDADGGDALRRQLGEPPELLTAGHEDVGLARQVGSSGLHQEQEREAVLLRHVHGTEELADGGRARRPAADGGVVGDDEALGVRHLGQRNHHAAADRVAGLQPGQRAELEHRRAGIDERLEALAHEHLAAGQVSFHVLCTAAGEDEFLLGAYVVDEHAHGGGVVPELVTRHGQARPKGRAHVVVSQEARRFCRNASMPSAASAPANSSAEVAAAADRPSVQPCAGSVRSSPLVARSAPGAA